MNELLDRKSHLKCPKSISKYYSNKFLKLIRYKLHQMVQYLMKMD